jgi:hypothetical protein
MVSARHLSRSFATLLVGVAVLSGAPAASAALHEGAPACSAQLHVEIASWTGSCVAPFQGFPVGVAGALYMDDREQPPRMDLDAEIGVDIWLLMADGSRKEYKPTSCSDAQQGIARGFNEKNFISDEIALGEGTVPEEIVGIECDAESRTVAPTAAKPTAVIACWSTSAGREDLEAEHWFSNYGFPPYQPPPPSSGGIDPFRTLSDAGVKSQVLAVPVDTYATTNVFVHRRLGLNYTNLDMNLHDVVARDDFRPNGSAPWCADFPSGKCPLFWTPLIGQQQQAPVLGLADAEPGRDYTFYCSIHPLMVGTISVVQ